MSSVVKFTKSLYFKLVVSLFICLGLFMALYTWYQCRQVRARVEKDLEAKGIGFAKAAALGLQTLIENDLKHGVITKEQLFDRNYKLTTDNADPKNRKFSSLFDNYTDTHWQKYVDSFLVDNDVVFAIPVAYSSDPDRNGYLPTHNTKYKDRSKRIFNDQTGAAAATTLSALKQVYRRDTGEIMWDMSYPVYVSGQHWGGYRVAISIQEAEAKIAAEQKRTIILMLVILTLITAFLLTLTITVIGRPLQRILKASQNLASGEADLTQRLEVKAKDELGLLADCFNSFIEKIQQIIKKIANSAENVAATSEQLSANGEEAAKATQQVARAIEQIAVGSGEQSKSVNDTVKVVGQVAMAIDQISAGAQEQSKNVISTTDLVADMANKIDRMAEGMETIKEVSEQNGIVAVNGGKAVEKTVQGMLRVKEAVFETAQKIHELGEQSQKIGEIIQVIDDIAEQTNLLALNAAIEAARAGEHGKGFAVVADEVRKLAERSGKATKEIADLITDIQRGTKLAVDSMQVGTKEVEDGVSLAQEAGQSLNEIVDGVKTAGDNVHKITGLINEILCSSQEVSKAVGNVAAITEENTAASQEMSAFAEQVNAAMENIASISEENAAAAEEVSASTEELTASVEEISSSGGQLNGMAQELQDLVAQFRL